MINVNIGVLGHVDSGKTSLCRCLSEVLSTCALDKHRQSQEKGITIDLGFSSFYIKKKKSQTATSENQHGETQNNKIIPKHGPNTNENKNKNEYIPDQNNVKKEDINNDCETGNIQNINISEKNHENELIQICLVDCPGHHSLIKCIVMGAKIMDMIFLVIDINKGIQKQTIECLVLCQFVKSDIIIILNKIDLIPLHERDKKINSMKKKIKDAINRTSLKKLSYYIVSLSANRKNRDDNEIDDVEIGKKIISMCRNSPNELNPHFNILKKEKNTRENINELVELLKSVIKIPVRETNPTFEDFYFLYDHSFEIKGKGMVYTGTVIKGKITINSDISILPLNIRGKIKDIQSFKKKQKEGTSGNRLSFLISHDNIKNLKKVERGIIVHEKSNICNFAVFICKIKLIEFYKKSIKNKELLTCIIGFASSHSYGFFFKKLKTDPKKEQTINVQNNEHNNGQRGGETYSTCLSNNIGFDRNGNYLIIDEVEYINHIDDGTVSENDLFESEKEYQNNERNEEIYFLVILKKKMYGFNGEKCIFLKNDENINCRICLHGNIVDIIKDSAVNSKINNSTFVMNKKPCLNDHEDYKNLKIMKEKEKIGLIEKVIDNTTLLCKNVFASSNQVTAYLTQKIYLIPLEHQKNKNVCKTATIGYIAKSFAKNGKFIVHFDDDISHIKDNIKLYIIMIKYYKDIFTKKKIFM
ncbi:selenocysteine-specific elongation factor selB homologue, putative [Plasmodium berghei]|uniref:Selenocysteine-specific elongation factor, putative n=2 Tax=Plasmodium berghei TaxID=5821 RepID=A0A509AEZ3_PLABA|nr:selenocysteine-specific elongation factor, putative [Plasmodium berghei ANKA]SCL89952.1 selenocysteine-specific elongation factor selB homologue, putative [Plasmodium berghei]SCM15185.1 selenocysteine-specific elongation factor selB homologue, putative [Plasmodium berghei]SCM16980.1 selenocysteine-specific elongation factor selB homologue, putative [Plasmodium berghei]SCN21806.1 selenocysteine-specific elongation factor selB homologue, putative [Plasmodium berghei]VUC53908.1 selenocysteine-|eukprot:XP_034419761.1 selenocysteine-specific elongation factor, putative [Plasmodium berghei ANKA]